MKIQGNTIGTPMKRPDFNQTDERKSDYIKNKPIPVIKEGDEGKIPVVEGGAYVLKDISVDAVNYVADEAERVADNVLSVRNSESFVMALASDFHANGSDDSSIGALHVGQGMDAISSMTQLDMVALLGDYEVDKFDGEDARKSFKYIKKVFSDIAKGVPFIQLQGNHDELPADTTEEARQKYYAYIGANNVGTVTDYANKYRNYGYRDFDNYKIRVIYLNTADVSDSEITKSCYVSAEQLSWLKNVALNVDGYVEATNQLPISTDANGNVYNGIGYKPNTILTESGGEWTSASNESAITGYIPIGANGKQVIYLNNIDVPFADGAGVMIALYNQNKEKIILKYGSHWKTPETATGSDIIYTLDDNGCLSTIDVSGVISSDVAYFRICAKGLDGDSVIAVNQPIVPKSEWGIIVLTHHPLNWYENMKDLKEALETYKGKNSGAELIAHFHGHIHNFRVERFENNLVSITIPNACFGRNNEYGTGASYSDMIKETCGDTDESGNQRVFAKTANTAEDTSFNAVVVDRQNKKIHCFNYGAGIDRVVNYGDEIEPSYTNLADPNADGWINNSRIGSDGTAKAEGACQGAVVTNYIYIPDRMQPVYIKGLNISVTSDNATPATARYASPNLDAYRGRTYIKDGIITVRGDVTEWIPNENVISGEYIRISGGLLDGYTAEDVVITVGEPIT